MITAKKWSKLEGYRVSALCEWSETVKLIIKNGISNLQRREFHVRPKILEDRHVKAYLNELQEKYVFVPADKAKNNNFCLEVLLHTNSNERTWNRIE